MAKITSATVSLGEALILSVFAVAYVLGAWVYPWPWSLLKRHRFARGGVIPKPTGVDSDDLPIFLSGERAWMRTPDGDWVEINDTPHRD